MVVNGTGFIYTDTHECNILRQTGLAAKNLVLQINTRPTEGFAPTLPSEIKARTEFLINILLPNQVSQLDIFTRRIIRRGATELDRGMTCKSYQQIKPGDPIG